VKVSVQVTGTGTQKHDTKTVKQEEAFYLVIQAGSKPGGQSNRATNPKRGRQNLKSGQQASRVVTGKSELVFWKSLESLAMTHKTIWQRTSGSEGAK